MGQKPGLPPLASPSLTLSLLNCSPSGPAPNPFLLRSSGTGGGGRGVVLGVRPPCMVLPELSRDSLGGKESGQGR